MIRVTTVFLLAGLLALSSLAVGCSANNRSFDPPPADDARPGPGLFSGDDGVFSVYGGPKEQEDPEEK